MNQSTCRGDVSGLDLLHRGRFDMTKVPSPSDPDLLPPDPEAVPEPEPEAERQPSLPQPEPV